MSKKHPGRDTEYAKWTSKMAKLDYELKVFHERLKKETKEGDIRKSKKRLREKDEEMD